MDSFSVIETQLQKVVEKRKTIILKAMDGRTQRALAEKTGIDETLISKWINGLLIFEQPELEKIDAALGNELLA